MGKSNFLNTILNPIYAKHYFKNLQDQFGIKFLALCVSVYFGIKGALRQFSRGVELPFYKSGNWSASQYQSNMTISSAPMTLKGICGILTDVFPILGYEKSSWFVIYTILGSLGCLIFVLFPMNETNVFTGLPALLFFCLQMEAAFLDLLAEAKYVELMNKTNSNRGNIVTFTYFCITLGEIIPNILIGSLDGVIHVRYLFLIFFPIALQPLIFIFFGCMVNDRAESHRNNKIDFLKLAAQKQVMLLAFIMLLACIGSVLFALFTNPTTQFIYAAVAGFICGLTGYIMLPRMIANVNIYIFIVHCAFVNITASLEYYYTANEDCVPGGPEFSILFMRTYAGVAGVIAKLLGIWAFQAILSHMKYRITFWSTTVLRCIASLADIILITRFNRYIGIPDEIVYFFGNAIAVEMCYMMDHMPSAVIMAKLCPKNVEGTVFAIISSFANFGQNVAKFAGGFLMSAFGIELDNEGCNTDNLLTIVIIGHLILPLLCIPLTFVLIPDAYVKENLANLIETNQNKYAYQEQIKNSNEITP